MFKKFSAWLYLLLIVVLAGQVPLAFAAPASNDVATPNSVISPAPQSSLSLPDAPKNACQIGVVARPISFIGSQGPINKPPFYGASPDNRVHRPGEELTILVVVANSTDGHCGEAQQLTDVQAELVIGDEITPVTLTFPAGNFAGELYPDELAFALISYTIPNDANGAVHIHLNAAANETADGFDVVDTDDNDVRVVGQGVSLPGHPVSRSWRQQDCHPRPKNTIFCDDFNGQTIYKDQTPRAFWWRYPFDHDNSTHYINMTSSYINLPTETTIKLELDENTSSNFYANADISTSEINNYEGDFLFGEDTRVEVRMRYSPNMNADPSDTTATAMGSAGLIFWNYFTGPADPELKDLDHVRDAFGFVWQDPTSLPTPGFWLFSVGQTVPGTYYPYFNFDLSQWHTYALERRHDSMSFYIDDQLLWVEPLNQPDSIQLPADNKLTLELWSDNATYLLDFNTFHMDLVFRDLAESQWVEIDYALVTKL